MRNTVARGVGRRGRGGLCEYLVLVFSVGEGVETALKGVWRLGGRRVYRRVDCGVFRRWVCKWECGYWV